MSKLEDMLKLSRKLAASTPRVGDRFVWDIRDWSEETAQFLYQDDAGTGLLIDPGPHVPALLSRGDDPLYIVWSDAAPADPWTQGAANFQRDVTSAHRRPTDLSVTPDQLNRFLGGACDLAGLQDLMSRGPGGGHEAPWLGRDVCNWVAASFLMNTLWEAEYQKAFRELARVLSREGVLRFTVLAADEPRPQTPFPYLGHTIIHVPLETDICQQLSDAGFHGMTIRQIADAPVLTSNGAELRLLGVEAYLGTSGVCLEQGDAAVYLGPWHSVTDDDGHTYPRGVRIAVCEKTAGLLSRPPYDGQFLILKAYDAPALETAAPFDCSRTATRSPAETKGRIPFSGFGSPLEDNPADACGPDCNC